MINKSLGTKLATKQIAILKSSSHKIVHFLNLKLAISEVLAWWPKSVSA